MRNSGSASSTGLIGSRGSVGGVREWTVRERPTERRLPAQVIFTLPMSLGFTGPEVDLVGLIILAVIAIAGPATDSPIARRRGALLLSSGESNARAFHYVLSRVSQAFRRVRLVVRYLLLRVHSSNIAGSVIIIRPGTGVAVSVPPPGISLIVGLICFCVGRCCVKRGKCHKIARCCCCKRFPYAQPPKLRLRAGELGCR